MPESIQGDRLEIIYQDNNIVAINKPAGILVHKSAMDRHETRFALQMTRDQIGQRVFPVHRLDKPTSGVLLFALNPAAARKLSLQFQENQVKKTYLAVVRGFTQTEGLIDYPLSASKESTPKDAVTEYTRLKTTELPFPVGPYQSARYSLVEIRPHGIVRRRRNISYAAPPSIHGCSRLPRIHRVKCAPRHGLPSLGPGSPRGF